MPCIFIINQFFSNSWRAIQCAVLCGRMVKVVCVWLAAAAGFHQCDICGHSYSLASSLQRHMKLHQGRTQCPLCGQVYSMVNNLRRHMRVGHQLDRLQTDRLISQQAALPTSLWHPWSLPLPFFRTVSPYSSRCDSFLLVFLLNDPALNIVEHRSLHSLCSFSL